MLGYFRPPTGSDAEFARARLWAAGALALLAVLMLIQFVMRPPREDVSPAALRVERIETFVEDVPACRSALLAAGFETAALPNLSESGRCGYDDGVELTRSVHTYSAPVAGACALTAALALWERDVVGPAAQEHLNQQVSRIEVASMYSCRRIAGRRDRRMSEHARANAIDISGFTLADGRVLRVDRGWRGSGRDRAFLRAVRDGACDHFKGVLSPDYNRAHRDHLHFDLGRDEMCR